ncbi:MAG: hypothetical protein JSW25_00800 [Thermoplasmata archaeon]|nr:MAG: hypothetical protein JSW25_00800 [Thermoplasmata archaeon]
MEPVAWTRPTMWSLLILLVALALTASLAMSEGAPEDEANGSPAGDGEWETEGDWTVNETETYENLTLLVNGNLTVEFGGTLTLRGVKLIMNATEDLQYTIEVLTNGELIVEDTDGDWTTTNDRSELRSWFQSARYTIEVKNGATMTVKRSKIQDLGDDVVVGLDIGSDDVLFEHVLFESFSSIFANKSSPTFLSCRMTGDLASSLYFEDSAALLESSTILNCYYGVNAKGDPAPILVDTDVANCFFPLTLFDAEMTMTGGLLESSPFGTDLTLVRSTADVVDVMFDQYNLNISDTSSTLNVHWTLSLRVTDQAYQPLEGATVEVNDTRGVTVFTGTTAADGMVDIQLLDAIITNTTRETRNLHSVWVEKERYHARVTFNVTVTMTREVSVLTNLAPFISVRSPTPGTRVVMGQVITFDASDTFDPNGDPMTFNWTTDIGDRLLYSGPEAVMEASLLLGESLITLTVSDGQGGVNSTTIGVEVLQASQRTLTVTESLYIATLEVTFGGSGDVLFEESSYPEPHPRELIGIFLRLRTDGDAIMAGADMTVTYSPTLLPYGMSEGSLVIAFEDGGIWKEVPGSSVDTETHTVTASVDSLGLYAVMGFMPENVPPRLWMQEMDQLVAPHDVEVGPGDPVDLFFIIEDELPSFVRLEVTHLPEFLRMDGTTHRITGTAPEEADSWELQLIAIDIGDLSDVHTITLSVNGSLRPPRLESGTVDPPDGDTYTHFEILVVYMSPEDLPPEYVRAHFGDNETVELIPVNLTDDDYRAGVLYHVFVRLEEGNHKIWFQASDGTRTTETEEPVKVTVESFGIEVTDQEMAIIIATIIATIIIILIIRTTSERYNQLKKAHYGLDSEDEVEYIEPGKEVTEMVDEEGEGDEEALPSDEDEGTVGAGDQVRVMDTEEMARLEEEVDRLEEELSEIDEDIDSEEAELARIDDEIEEIIDELDDDRDRAA